MKKNNFGFIALLFAASFCLVSCSKELSDVEGPVNGYRISIPVRALATKAVAEGNGEASFKTTENVYVYNRTTKTMDDAVLHPADDAASTTFEGTLNKTYSEGDNLLILYNTSSNGVVDYSAQDGSIANVKDAGKGEVSISSISEDVINTGAADIENLQSIFRFVFKAGGTELSGIRFVRIFSSNNKLQTQYDVVKDTPTYGPITISGSTDLEDSDHYLYAGLRFAANPDDEIVFQVVTSDGKVYSGSKNAPSAGFVNGKFYKSTVNVNLYTFTVSSEKTVCFSPGDLGVDNGVYSFTEPFVTWGWKATSTSTAKRVWFNYSEITSGLDICGIDWRNPNSLTTSTSTPRPQEWESIIARTNMNSGVDPYYWVTVSNHANCLLLPPDETQASDIGEDLASGAVTDYTKYLGKGFVLLISTGRATYQNKLSWGMDAQGFYWALWNNMSRNRTYFYWKLNSDGSHSGPEVSWATSQFRMRVRLIHDVTVE